MKDSQLLVIFAGHLNWMRNYSVLRRCGYTDIFLHVCQLATVQHDSAE
jgi:hypothetical protein